MRSPEAPANSQSSFSHGVLARCPRHRAVHAVGGGELVIAERAGRVFRVGGEPGDDHLADGGAPALLHRDGEIDEPARARRRAVRAGDVDAVDKDHAQIAVLGGALGGDVRLPARRQEFAQRRVRHHEIELHPEFGIVLDERLGLRRTDAPSASETARPANAALPPMASSLWPRQLSCVGLLSAHAPAALRGALARMAKVPCAGG